MVNIEWAVDDKNNEQELLRYNTISRVEIIDPSQPEQAEVFRMFDVNFNIDDSDGNVRDRFYENVNPRNYEYLNRLIENVTHPNLLTNHRDDRTHRNRNRDHTREEYINLLKEHLRLLGFTTNALHILLDGIIEVNVTPAIISGIVVRSLERDPYLVSQKESNKIYLTIRCNKYSSRYKPFVKAAKSYFKKWNDEVYLIQLDEIYKIGSFVRRYYSEIYDSNADNIIYQKVKTSIEKFN